MAKGKAKTNSSSVSAAQPRSLRSRKREFPSDGPSETDDQEPTVKAPEEREATAAADPSSDSQLKGLKSHADNNGNRAEKDKEEMTAEEFNTSPSQTCTDQLQVFSPASEEGDDAALGDQLSGEENSCHFEKKQEVSKVYMTDVKEHAKEAAAGLPAKKKRRMGMCGLTERERSHFLQTTKNENGQNLPERDTKQICSNTADLASEEEIVSSISPSLSVQEGNGAEQEKAEMNLQSSHCGGEDREEPEVHTASCVVSDPGCSKGNSCEVEGGERPGPEPTGAPKSDLPAVENEEELLGNQSQQEHEGGTAEVVAEKRIQLQLKGGNDGSAAVDRSAAITGSSKTPQSDDTENRDAAEAALLPVNSVTRTRGEESPGEERDGDVAEAGASSTHTRPGGVAAVQPCEAPVTPSGSEMKNTCDSDGEPGAGSSTANAEPPQTGDTSDPFGSGFLDYVSDSQLNTIILTEEVMEREEDLCSPDHEDATDLICGLIKELSALNRRVMVAHRELENQRRSKGSRGCKR
uniref:nuclear receptor corepressor 1-like isoform X3 n=1 Tax=Gasterosteus aculeatus aculeatus TaxID=481459 RepID=UPI001A98AFD3|nr:nuclear receptor corepressor 1-like isoform X3 [Gasterosteus aculeatus aculeatus]